MSVLLIPLGMVGALITAASAEALFALRRDSAARPYRFSLAYGGAVLALLACLIAFGTFARIAAAQEVPQAPPVLDAFDKSAMALAIEAQKLAQSACQDTSELKHYDNTRKHVDELLTARYPGFRLDWAKGVLVPIK